MKYSVTISKEELCDFDFLKNNFKKEKIQGVFKDNIIQVIQALIALSIGFIISFGLIALNMRMDIKTILLNKIITLSNIDIKIILLILSYLPFIVILFFQIVCLGLFLKFYYRLKYSYLIGTFEIYIKENIIILDSKYRKFFIDLSKCKKKRLMTY